MRTRLFFAVPDGTEVKLTPSKLRSLPLPDPRFLGFHAALAKVIHMAGMAEHLDEIIRKQDEVRVLSDDTAVEYLDGVLRMTQKLIAPY